MLRLQHLAAHVPVGPFAEAIRWDQTGIFASYLARTSPQCRVTQRLRRGFVGCGHQAPPGSRSHMCSTTRDRPGKAGIRGGQGARILRISGGLRRAGAEHHAHQRGFGELEIHSNPSPTKLNFVGLAEMRISGGLGSLKSTLILGGFVIWVPNRMEPRDFTLS